MDSSSVSDVLFKNRVAQLNVIYVEELCTGFKIVSKLVMLLELYFVQFLPSENFINHK